MNYKKVIKNRQLRLFLLRVFSAIPDKWMLKLQYRLKFNRRLDLKNPKRFTEKLQWYKLNSRTPLMKQCVDKYEVREYVSRSGFSEILIPLLGIYTRPQDIPFDEFPSQFVMKDTLGGGGNSVLICTNKNILDQKRAIAVMKRWVRTSTSYRLGGREWVYGGRKHRIIIEKFLDAGPGEQLIDYKFFCFHGNVEYLYVIADREVGQKVKLGIFDANFKKRNVIRCDERPLDREIEKPLHYETMKVIAETLAKPFLEARIDLYNVNGNIYFGEITFFDGSGYMSFDPDEFDFEMGEKFLIARS